VAALALWWGTPLALAQAGGRPASPPAAAGPAYADHLALDDFAALAAQRHGLEADWVRGHVAQARRSEAVRRLIMPPPAGTPRNWTAYRDRFVERERIAAGVAFWRAHAAWLARAEAEHGVPPEIVVAIVGVETFYGRIMGSFRVLDALATLTFDFPPGRRDRSAFFRDELEALLVWCRREELDPQEPRGSFAGAIGLPQFMPSSILRFGVDFDRDGRIDLRRNPADVVGSVAHYLGQFGWQRGLPTHFDAQAPEAAEDRAVLLAPDIVPTFSAAQMAERGARLAAPAAAHDGPLALVELENGGRPNTYYAGTTNFYAVTRYNWSSYYAMAVILLAEALRAAV
jgi:membrane-bound lytic murein transglycosylase B